MRAFAGSVQALPHLGHSQYRMKFVSRYTLTWSQRQLRHGPIVAEALLTAGVRNWMTRAARFCSGTAAAWAACDSGFVRRRHPVVATATAAARPICKSHDESSDLTGEPQTIAELQRSKDSAAACTGTGWRFSWQGRWRGDDCPETGSLRNSCRGNQATPDEWRAAYPSMSA